MIANEKCNLPFGLWQATSNDYVATGARDGHVWTGVITCGGVRRGKGVWGCCRCCCCCLGGSTLPFTYCPSGGTSSELEVGAEPSDASTPKEDRAVPSIAARKVTRSTPVDETKPLLEGDWLSDNDITTWLTDELYPNEIGDPWAWTLAVTYIMAQLKIMRKYKDNQATRGGLAWGHSL